MQRCPFLSFDEQAAKRKLLKMFEVADTCKSCVECRGVTDSDLSSAIYRLFPSETGAGREPLRCPDDALDHPIAAG